MKYRPMDESGDVLPVLTSADMIRGSKAEAQLVNDRLNMLSGEWWENLVWGNASLEMLKDTRFTDADQRAMFSYLISYIRETPGVLDVRDADYSIEGRQFRFSCTIETEDGTASTQYEL